jgi:hypothetical protein
MFCKAVCSLPLTGTENGLALYNVLKALFENYGSPACLSFPAAALPV